MVLVYVDLLDVGRVVFFDGCGTESVGLNPYLLHPARGWDNMPDVKLGLGDLLGLENWVPESESPVRQGLGSCC